MTQIDWRKEVEQRKDELIATTQEFLRIKSVMDLDSARPGAPFGEGVNNALQFALRVCQEAGMTIKDVEGYAGHAEFGAGQEMIGVLSHVDVVPEGEGWTTAPYAAEIVGDRIVARGAIDDKGPAMAAIFAAKIVMELGLPLAKRVRLIFGTDEETLWRCMNRYFQTEEMPSMGFTPDADFPLIYAEKGLTHFIWRQTAEAFAKQRLARKENPDARLVRLHSGLRMNMVPERAEATLVAEGKPAEELADSYRAYLQASGRTGEVTVQGNELTLTMQGISVHGMDPGRGVNAGTELTHFLTHWSLDERAEQYVRFTDTYLYNEHYGVALGINHDDAEMGPLTLNTGILGYDAREDALYHINIRYPHSQPYAAWEPIMLERLQEAGFALEVEENMVPHRVEPSHPLVTTLQRIYTEHTQEPAHIMAIGGCTYGRSLDVGVAFGPVFPGRPDCAHQRDEYILIDDLLRATAIYAQAIYELAQE